MADVPIYDLGDPIWMQLVADDDTPADLRQYGGRWLSVLSTTMMPPLGTRGLLRVSGVEVPGYLRTAGGTYDWVMQPPQSPLEALVLGLPGTQGWTDPAARQVWLDIGSSLLGLGVSMPELRGGLAALYSSARTNLLAEYGVTA